MDVTKGHLNYFTCTLGEAVQWKRDNSVNSHSFDTVISLLDAQAERIPNHPAVAFANDAQWTTSQRTLYLCTYITRYLCLMLIDA